MCALTNTIRLLTAGLALTAFAVPVLAETHTWTGNINSSWVFESTSGATNWIPGNSIPGAGDVVQFTGPSTHTTISLDGQASAQSLLFATPVSYSIVPGLVGSTLTLSSGDVEVTAGSHAVPDITLSAQGIWNIARNAQFEVTGVLTGLRLDKGGPGALLLTGGTDGAPSTLGTLRCVGGEAIIDGARIDLTSISFDVADGAMNTDGDGRITIQNGADVRMPDVEPAFGAIENGTLTVTDNNTLLSGYRLDTAALAGNGGTIVVQVGAHVAVVSNIHVGYHGVGRMEVLGGPAGGGTVEANGLFVGVNSTNVSSVSVEGEGSRITTDSVTLGGNHLYPSGGNGRVDVLDGGLLQTNVLVFWSSQSAVGVDAGRLETDRLAEVAGVPGSITISDPLDGGSALTVGHNDGSSTFGGVIQESAGGPGSLRKVGSGTFTIAGSNTYAGGTTIDGGVLRVINTTGSATGSGPVTVGAGTLSGDGSIDGAITVQGGDLSPGAPVGQMNAGSAELEGGANLVIEIVSRDDFDSLALTGSAQLGGNLEIALLNDTPDASESFTILTASSVTGTFDNVGDVVNSRVTTVQGEGTFLVTYNAGSVVLSDFLPTTTCPGDIVVDGVVDVEDLLALINLWGSSDPAADLDGSGVVDTDDLLALINAWGMCPGV